MERSSLPTTTFADTFTTDSISTTSPLASTVTTLTTPTTFICSTSAFTSSLYRHSPEQPTTPLAAPGPQHLSKLNLTPMDHLLSELKSHISAELNANLHQFKTLISTEITTTLTDFQTQIQSTVVSQNSIIDDLQQQINKLKRTQQSLKDHEAQLRSINSTLKTHSGTLHAPQSHMYQPEESATNYDAACFSTKPNVTPELLISNLPPELTVAPIEIAQEILAKLGLAHLSPDILCAEPFPRPSRRGSTSQQDFARNRPTSTIVVTLKSCATRDFIVSRRLQTDTFTNAKVFSTQQTTSIFIRPLYPKPIYCLLQAARSRCKQLHLSSPIVSNSTVFVRKDSGSTFIPIYNEADLNNSLCLDRGSSTQPHLNSHSTSSLPSPRPIPC